MKCRKHNKLNITQDCNSLNKDLGDRVHPEHQYSGYRQHINFILFNHIHLLFSLLIIIYHFNHYQHFCHNLVQFYYRLMVLLICLLCMNQTVKDIEKLFFATANLFLCMTLSSICTSGYKTKRRNEDAHRKYISD